ncbi:TetR family transcriptional regulator [Isoptericola jiangsuensis]|uniref:TetR family transcriptional regulator n=1 Tax=Isoptericola jiangsuensis TaxID=548579 RepID=A0A2A9ETD8_9MICO|nr:TetR/AcrR family transcriptional regulator [Isoptericola jiangsuensis]PFG42013.1 TetR family transcriptional regulator [Isoptericola jiangsuensis]
MPRITEATVVEHREARRAALLDAARELLTERPEEAPALGLVAERAGMSRSAVYHYFRSREDLLDALIEEAFPRWERRLGAAMEGLDSPRDKVLAFVGVNLALVADGEHALAQTLATVVQTEEMARRARAFHEGLLSPLREAFDELGVADAGAMIDLVNALVLAAARRLESTGDLEAAQRSVVDLLDPYLRAQELPGH